MSETLFTSSDGIDPEVVEAARAELAAKLPELRKLPGFPVGSDEDILKMSVPPYYTACPNPFMKEWLDATSPDGYDDRSYVDPGPYASDVSASKGHLVYKAHAYWTKVPHELIMRYILHYTKPGDVVLDGFAGTGMTGVAAQACGAPEAKITSAIEAEMGEVEWGSRRAVLQDLAPVASFIAAGLNLPIDAGAFNEASRLILDQFDAEWGWMYETTHKDGSTVRIDYTIWSEVFTCPSCGGEIVFYDTAFDTESGKVDDEFACPTCGAVLTKKRLDRRHEFKRDARGELKEVLVFRPVLIRYKSDGVTFSKRPDEKDLRTFDQIDLAVQELQYPDEIVPYHYRMMWLRNQRLASDGSTRAHHFWQNRALVSLAFLWAEASAQSDTVLRFALLFWVEQAIWGLSRMNRYMAARYSQTNRQMMGVYYVPSLAAEVHPRMNLEGRIPSKGKRQSLVKLWSQHADYGSTLTSTGSAVKLDLSDSSIDYVFVDPPFGENIYYSDLNYLIEVWHSVKTNEGAEAIVNASPEAPRRIDEYQLTMTECFVEFFRVLKPGRWMTVEFSNSSNEIWLAIQEAIASAGFVVADTRVLDKQQGTFQQYAAKNAVKRDLIISCYKPSSETEERFGLSAGSPEGAWEFVSEHLSHLPVIEGQRGEGMLVRERFADRLYDRMVAYHVHRSVSVPLTAAEFYSGLEQRFPVRDDMYFLPEQIEEYERHRMTFKELAQLEMFITGEASAVQWLRQLLKKKPRTYAQIQPLFFDELQAGLPEWEELPELRELLEESFLQDDQDRWFVPDPKKSVDLEAQRTKGLLKEFELYMSGKGKLSSFRSEAVRAGFKDAWGRRDFGMIVAVGERLPSDAFVEDEALLYYYDNARRLMPESK